MDGKTSSPDEIYDVIIIGAGLSGINAAYRLQSEIPDYTYTILEARDALGGTWDFFKYPGIRSDSDLHTFGYPFQPWPAENDIADGPSIKKYLQDTATKYGIDRRIQYHKKVTAADWSSDLQAWRLTIDANGTKETYYGRFLVLGTGYYDYDNPLPAVIPGIENFKGKVVHPQSWPTDLNYTDKNIVIIGSGATAVTLLPNLAAKATKVTMLQRSPSYVAARPMYDPIVLFAKRWLPTSWGYSFARWKNLIAGYLLVLWCRTYPLKARKMLKDLTTKELPSHIAQDPNFEPSYNPWEQRLCLTPDGDFFASLRAGKGDVVTGKIRTMTPSSIVLESGAEIPADIIVTATGLKMQLVGGTAINVDNEPLVPREKFIWRGTMVQDVPNAFVIIGYTNASWTPGSDATCQLICRLLKRMRARGETSATPRVGESARGKLKPAPFLKLSSTYIKVANSFLPMDGGWGPWKVKSNYFVDLWNARWGSLTDEVEFVKRTS